MPGIPNARRWWGLALGLLVLTPAGVGAQGASKKVTFTTADGVELVGTYFPSAGGKKDACVLLLHDFDHSKGGNSHQDGWDDLAAKLQTEGYAVLSFDFGGFGNSKSVLKSFWAHRHNQALPGFRKMDAFIDQKEFRRTYYPHLVNDVIAAKGFLDGKNDTGELNSSSVVVIGAGQGATVGALWMATQTQLKRNNNPIGLPVLAGRPESQDLAGAVWLTITPTLAGQRMPAAKWLVRAGADHTIPMVFVYGKDDDTGAGNGPKLVDILKRSTREELKETGHKAIDGTDLTGSKLLNKRLPTIDWIVKEYVNKVIEKRGARLQKEQKLKESSFYWVDGRDRPVGVAKQPLVQELVQPVPLNLFDIR